MGKGGEGHRVMGEGEGEGKGEGDQTSSVKQVAPTGD